MHYFERIAKGSADEILQKMLGGKSTQEFRNKFGEESFNLFVELLRNDSKLVAINWMKWAVTLKTILGLFGYYLDRWGGEYEKDGNGHYVLEKDYIGHEMLFRVEENNRKITVTYDMEIPVPKNRKMTVSRILAKINNNEELKLEIHNGHVRWETSYTVKNDITDDSMAGDVMHHWKVHDMIDSIVRSFQVVYPVLIADFYKDANPNDEFEL